MSWVKFLLRTALLLTVFVAVSPAVFATEPLSGEPDCVASILDDGSQVDGDPAAGSMAGDCGHHCQNCLPLALASSVAINGAAVVEAVGGQLRRGLASDPLLARGQSNLSKALAQASAIGLTEESVRSGLSAPEVTEVITASASLARDLGINGTPSFILADEIIPGAVGVEVLREKIENVRSCGSTRCVVE